jgi:hypothetical protein
VAMMLRFLLAATLATALCLAPVAIHQAKGFFLSVLGNSRPGRDREIEKPASWTGLPAHTSVSSVPGQIQLARSLGQHCWFAQRR